MRLEAQIAQIAEHIDALPTRDRRRFIALVGPPASGKSTLSHALAKAVPHAAVIPMDGFHLDNRILEARGLLARKGAPDTFDVEGFAHLIRRLKAEDNVIYPVFNRDIDAAIAGAGSVGPETRTLIVEGNYLLLDKPRWRDLAPLWDLSVYLSVSEDVLRARLMQRWRDQGLNEDAAAAKTDRNDLPNAREVAAHLIAPDVTISNTGQF